MDSSVAGKFYRDIQETFVGQIVIMENTDPPEPVADGTIDIVFTNNPDYGRAGFFPERAHVAGFSEDHTEPTLF